MVHPSSNLLDQGVIELLKMRYCCIYVGFLLKKIESGCDHFKAKQFLNIKDVIYITVVAWKERQDTAFTKS